MIEISTNNELKPNKREYILDVAALLFSANDFHEVNMDLIAKKAEIAKGTIYNYFKSKEELYFAIIETRLSKLINELSKKIKEQLSVLEDLRGFIIHLFMFMMKYQNFFLIFQKARYRLQKLNHSEIENKMQTLKEMLLNIIQEGIDSGVFRKVDPCFTADIILGIIFSAVHRNIGRDLHDAEVLKERNSLFDFIKDGLKIHRAKTEDLSGKTILLTRTLGQSEESAKVFLAKGAEVIILPTLKIIPPSSWKMCDEAIREIEKFDTIIFSSAHAVRWFVNRLSYHEVKFDFSKCNVIAIGPKTADECKLHSIPVSFIPKVFSSSGLINELKHEEISGRNFLIPQSGIGTDEVSNFLVSMGAGVKQVPVYDVSIPDLTDIEDSIHLMNRKSIDIYTFTSPSTYLNYLSIFKIENPQEYFSDKIVAAIGPTTANEIEKHRVIVQILPEEHHIEGLANAMVKYFNTKDTDVAK